MEFESPKLNNGKLIKNHVRFENEPPGEVTSRSISPFYLLFLKVAKNINLGGYGGGEAGSGL